MKKLLLAVLIAALVLTSLGCGATGSSASGTTASGGTYSVGQTAKMGDLELTVTKAEKNPGTQFDPPDSPDDVFLVVSVTMKNNNMMELLTYKPEFFTVRDADGKTYAVHPSKAGQMGDLYSGSVTGGPGSEPITGNYIFEVPKAATGLTLVYKNTEDKGGPFTCQFKLE